MKPPCLSPFHPHLRDTNKISPQWLRKRLPYAAVWEKSWNTYDYSSKQSRLSALRPADAGLRYMCSLSDQPPNCDTAKSGASGELPPATLRSDASNGMLALERADWLVDTTATLHSESWMCRTVYLSSKHSGNYTRHPFTVRNPSICPQDIPVYFFGHHNK